MVFKLILCSILVLAALDLFDVQLVQYLTFGKGLLKDPCSKRKHKLLSLLNLLCNETQNTSLVTRDACYGCFFRAAILTNGAILLTQLSICATLYLNNTIYQPCATQLDLVATGLAATSAPTALNCYTGYCAFVQCIRRTNSWQLIDNCLLTSLGGLSLTNQSARVAFYTNTTSCILASARCDPYNPITGMFQGTYGSQAQLTISTSLANAVQVTPNGDIRIVSFPRTTFTTEPFCSSSAGLEQSTSGICSVV